MKRWPTPESDCRRMCRATTSWIRVNRLRPPRAYRMLLLAALACAIVNIPGMVQGRVTLCNAKYRAALSAGTYSRSICAEKEHKPCHAKCYLRVKKLEPC